MSDFPTDPAPLWHQALAYAVTGRRIADLGRQRRPELAALAAELRRRAASGEIALLRGPGIAVPAELRAGLGWAQWAAALEALVQELELDPAEERTAATRAPDADERRLLSDAPPHHLG